MASVPVTTHHATVTMSPQRASERRLADIAVIDIPASIKNESFKGYRDDQSGRLTFGFSSTYFWASFGSTTAYKQLLIVSVMAPDATDAEYAAMPHRLPVGYDKRKKVRTSAVGSGTLTIVEGVYTLANLNEPAYEYLYVDRSRRLQLAWHAVKKEVDLAAGVAQITRMAASFRIVRDPLSLFAAQRDAPRQQAVAEANREAEAKAMLMREGYGPLEPGKPVLRDGIYVEWMADPEPRYQLLVPLGAVRVAGNATPASRPRPVRAGPPLAGTIGWYESVDGAWEFSNQDNGYLPFAGVSAVLAARQQDRGMVYFYYSATVRVAEEERGERLSSLVWFKSGLAEVQRRWRAGTLVSPGRPEPD
jgi:hypothetical protein